MDLPDGVSGRVSDVAMEAVGVDDDEVVETEAGDVVKGASDIEAGGNDDTGVNKADGCAGARPTLVAVVACFVSV